MKLFRLMGFILLLTIAGVACRPQATPQDSSITIDVTTGDEFVVGESSFVVQITDAAGNTIEDATLNVRGDMDHAGMVPVIRDITTSTAGEFTVPFEWTMAGDWSVEFTATLPDGKTASRTIDYTIAPSDGEGMDMEGMDHGSMEDDNNMEGMDHGGMSMGETSAIYLTIANDSDDPVTIVGATTSVAGIVEIHETTIENDVARMAPVDKIVIGSGDTVELMPGGKHIMLMDLTQNLVIGDEIEFTLQFEDRDDLTVTAVVQDMLMDDLPETVENNALSLSNIWARPAMAGSMDMDMESVSDTGE